MVNNKYKTKDSGKRTSFVSGMVRDVQEDKARFEFLIPLGQKYEDALITRWAMLMTRGADKYGDRNWEKANGVEEMNRFKSSAFRHFMQWFCDEDDEDHAAAVLFNINGYEYVKEKLNEKS